MPTSYRNQDLALAALIDAHEGDKWTRTDLEVDIESAPATVRSAGVPSLAFDLREVA